MSFFEQLTGTEYSDAIRRLLPRGKIWTAINAALGLTQTVAGSVRP
jgi:hypothetical protein